MILENSPKSSSLTLNFFYFFFSSSNLFFLDLFVSSPFPSLEDFPFFHEFHNIKHFHYVFKSPFLHPPLHFPYWLTLSCNINVPGLHQFDIISHMYPSLSLSTYEPSQHLAISAAFLLEFLFPPLYICVNTKPLPYLVCSMFLLCVYYF